MRVDGTALFCMLCISAVGAVAQQAEAPAAFHRIADEYWELRLGEDPLFAMDAGERRDLDRLPDVSEPARRRRAEHAQRLLERLREIDPANLSERDLASRQLLERLLSDRIREHEFRAYLMPITARTGFHVVFPRLPQRVPLETAEDYAAYIARLRAFPGWVRQHVALMRQGVELGYHVPAAVLFDWERAVDAQIVADPTLSMLYPPFADFPAGISPVAAERLEDRGRQAIRSYVVPGYRELRKFMRDEYVPSARESVGASALPDGKAFYAHRVRRFTTLDLTPGEVYEIGMAEVRRIRKEMQAIVDALEFEGGMQEFLTFLRTDERFYVETPEELMEKVSRTLKRMDGELPGLFKTLPRTPYGIRRVPDFIAPRTTTAYYERPAGDGSRAGFYYVNTHDLKSRPLYEIEALSFHEAVPGHHLQVALQQELEGLPRFRRYTDVTAFVEGWALYAEILGREVGFYADPYSEFGRLSYQMWRALRLVVDPGMHSLGWSRQRAIDFMRENSALAEHNIAVEVDRYIANPGQSLAYKMGELKIRELRAEAEKRLGADFDLREFHDAVLRQGAIPLDLLERRIHAWIEEETPAD